MKKLIIALLITTLLVVGCTTPEGKVTYDEYGVDTKVSEEVDQMTRSLIEGIRSGNMSDAKSELYDIDEGIESGFNVEDFLVFKDVLGNEPVLVQRTFTEFSEESISVTFPNSNGYVSVLPVFGSDALTSYYTIDFNGDQLLLMTNAIKNSNGEWKISKFNIGNYILMDKDIEAWTTQAKNFMSEEKTLPAFFSQYIASFLLEPNKYTKYSKYDEVKENFNTINTTLNKQIQLPIEVSIGEEKLIVYAIEFIQAEKGVAYQVKYVTNNPEVIEEELKEEAQALHEALLGTIKGFGEGLQKNVFYISYKEPPVDPNVMYDGYAVKIEQ